jgi:hypothetical protein
MIFARKLAHGTVPASVIDECPLSIMSKYSLTVVDAAAWVTGVPNSSTGEFSLRH